MPRRSNPLSQTEPAERPDGSRGPVLPDWAKADSPAIKRRASKPNPIPTNLRRLTASKPQLLTVDQAAERLVVSSRTVRRMITDGRLKHVKIGRAVRVSEAALAAFILGEMP